MKTHGTFYEQDNLRWNMCQWVSWDGTQAEAQDHDNTDTIAFLKDPITEDLTILTGPVWYSEDA
jgi:uncharacterized protein CbrC (UPF0167 family)